MGANSQSSGNLARLSDLDALYTRVYNLKNKHINSVDQKNKSALTAPTKSTSGLKQGDSIKVSTANYALLKSELANLANSKWWTPNSSGNTYTQMPDYSTSISIPNVGDLLQASNFNLLETAITNAENVNISYSGHYSGRYSTCYSTCYSSDYSSDYSTCYSGRYGSDYSSRYSTCYRTCYQTCYGVCYGSRYRTCYSGRYSAQYLNRC